MLRGRHAGQVAHLSRRWSRRVEVKPKHRAAEGAGLRERGDRSCSSDQDCGRCGRDPKAQAHRPQGPGSGHGGTATKGTRATRRAPVAARPGPSSGQMPLTRRIPSSGSGNPFRVAYQVVNVGLLEESSMRAAR